MTATSIVLVGVPDSGKTNFIGRLWIALQAKKGRLIAPVAPADISYVEETIAHLCQGEFAPRSEDTLGQGRRDFVVPVLHKDGTGDQPIQLVVPDARGELWKSAVSSFEIPQAWMDHLKQSVGALLFVRVQSKHNVQPTDWVTSEKALIATAPVPSENDLLPTQVVLCELLRFLEFTLKSRNPGSKPRVAVVVTAWDRLDDRKRAAGLNAYLKKEYPMFAGRIQDIESLEVRVFGTSVVGGDFTDPAFKGKFLETGDLKTSGYCILSDGKTEDPDLTVPVAWLIEP